MSPFGYLRPERLDDALAAGGGGARFIAGGTNLLDLMKIDVEQPATLVDINRLPFSAIERTATGLRIGALARMSDVAAHPEVAAGYPVVAEALLASASPQLRNMASIGGNLLQRTRCTYFRDTASACNKRVPGSGCAAIAGENRRHAILGISPACIATHASDLAVALVALDAALLLHGPQGERSVALDDF
ncbi:MAG: xanthine dehydrogenase family protein subunit M, partial [Zoogloea sp.]|nr:xanthine dehydrogenase family protein subunit M [Zoogloea sp.]